MLASTAKVVETQRRRQWKRNGEGNGNARKKAAETQQRRQWKHKGEGSGNTREKAVATHGEGSGHTGQRQWTHRAKAVETQGEGSGHSRRRQWPHTTKAVATQGKGSGHTGQMQRLTAPTAASTSRSALPNGPGQTGGQAAVPPLRTPSSPPFYLGLPRRFSASHTPPFSCPNLAAGGAVDPPTPSPSSDRNTFAKQKHIVHIIGQRSALRHPDRHLRADPQRLQQGPGLHNMDYIPPRLP